MTLVGMLDKHYSKSSTCSIGCVLCVVLRHRALCIWCVLHWRKQLGSCTIWAALCSHHAYKSSAMFFVCVPIGVCKDRGIKMVIMMILDKKAFRDSHVSHLSLVYACSVSGQYIVFQIHAFIHRTSNFQTITISLRPASCDPSSFAVDLPALFSS